MSKASYEICDPLVVFWNAILPTLKLYIRNGSVGGCFVFLLFGGHYLKSEVTLGKHVIGYIEELLLWASLMKSEK